MQPVAAVWSSCQGYAINCNMDKQLQTLAQMVWLLSAGLLFDWLYPAHFPTLRACLEAWADSPDVTTAMLKFMAEFALNKTQRLTFDSSSPNGILLFREVSKVGFQMACDLPSPSALSAGSSNCASRLEKLCQDFQTACEASRVCSSAWISLYFTHAPR